MAKQPITNTAPDTATPAVPEVAEERPARGGSYVRNEDGTLTQTEGHDVAATQPSKE